MFRCSARGIGRLWLVVACCWSPLLYACTFEPPPVDRLRLDPGAAPLAPLLDASSTTMFVDPGAMQVHHGRGCAEANDDATNTVLRVRQSQAIDRSLNHALVLLNGWRLSYLDDNHEVFGLGTGIQAINRRPLDDGNHLLEWEAYGAIFDQNGDDPYRWCYYFTVVAWDGDAYRASTAQRDALTFEERLPPNIERWTTALAVIPAFVELPSYFAGRHENVVVLPRGFAFVWAGSDDHNLLQLAYDLAPGDRYAADGKRYAVPAPALGGSDQASDFWSWETKTIFKDNALRRKYFVGEIVSLVAGSGVAGVHPPFTLTPVEDSNNCVSLGQPDSEARTVEAVPFDVAIPVLTGWDLSYTCDDEHVAEIGIWLEGFDFDPGAPERRADGTLEYLVHYRLNDGGHGNTNLFRHRASLLGFTKTQREPEPPAPSLSILPEIMRFPYPDHRGLPAALLALVMTNTGNAPATRSALRIVGPDAAMFTIVNAPPPARTIGPADSEDFHLRFDVPCSAAPDQSVSWQATLEIDTSEGGFAIPLIGREYPCL